MQTIQTVQQQQQQQQQQQPVDSIKQSPPASQQSQQTAAPSVLRVIVENMCYQITVDTLKQVGDGRRNARVTKTIAVTWSPHGIIYSSYFSTQIKYSSVVVVKAKSAWTVASLSSDLGRPFVTRRSRPVSLARKRPRVRAGGRPTESSTWRSIAWCAAVLQLVGS